MVRPESPSKVVSPWQSALLSAAMLTVVSAQGASAHPAADAHPQAAPAQAAPQAAPAAKAEAHHPAASSTFTFTILHTNDMHGHLLSETDKKMAADPEKVGGAPFVAALIERERKAHPDALLIDGGDIAQGTPISNLFRGKPMVDFMNAVHYDAGTIGNHEFDWGPQALYNQIAWAERPIVCANLRLKGSGLPLVGTRDFIIKKVNGVKIGIAGLATPTTPTMSFARNMEPFVFVDAAETMKRVLPHMKQAGAEIIVVASHLGDDEDAKLAKAVPGIHVIVGGHSHKPMPEPMFVNDTVIVQAGKYMRYLGEVTVTVNRATAKVVDFTRKDAIIPVLNSKIAPDEAVASIIKKYADQVGPAMSEAVGEASSDLSRTTADGSTDSVLGNVVCDAMRAKTHADLAVYNAGGIRSEINKGTVRMSDVYTLLPFDNVLVTLSLTGAQVQRLLEQGLGSGHGSHGTIQVSGLTFAFSPSGKVSDVRVGGQVLDPSRTYRVSTVDFLAEGNDGLTVLKEGTSRVYDELARDVFTAYMRANSPLQPPATGRIQRLK